METFFELASAFLELSNELQSQAMMLLLLKVPLLTLIVHEQQCKSVSYRAGAALALAFLGVHEAKSLSLQQP